MFIDDWKRVKQSYECIFEGEKYHVVQDRGHGAFRIEPNQPNITSQHRNSLCGPDFGKRQGHKVNLHNAHDSRFESFNKSPSIVMKGSPSFTFAHSTSRTEDLFSQNLYTDPNVFGRTDSGPFYDSNKDKVLKKLDKGLIAMSRQPSRGMNRSSPNLNNQVSCVDIHKANETYEKLKSKKGKNAPNFEKQLYRDSSKNLSKSPILDEMLNMSRDSLHAKGRHGKKKRRMRLNDSAKIFDSTYSSGAF